MLLDDYIHSTTYATSGGEHQLSDACVSCSSSSSSSSSSSRCVSDKALAEFNQIHSNVAHAPFIRQVLAIHNSDTQTLHLYNCVLAQVCIII